MQAKLLELICCPSCTGDLSLENPREQGSEIWEGALVCIRCKLSYPIEKGMPLLYIDDEKWAPKAKEAEGWVTFHKDLGIFEVVEDAVDLKIPYYPEEPWIQVARSFDIALEQLQLVGNETILDLGAGRGWAAKEFAKRGCRVVALDIVADENVGLGRAKAIMDHHGVYFDRIIADGESLPFVPEKFDLVFCAATLHHSSYLALLAKNIQKILRPGGRLCAINEPCISIISDENKVLLRDATQELDVGINETRPNLITYDDALTGAGLRIVEAFPPLSHGKNEAAMISWAKELGAVWPALNLKEPGRTLALLRKYYTLRLLSISKGTYWAGRRIINRLGNPAHIGVLLWCEGELFLIAEKP